VRVSPTSAHPKAVRESPTRSTKPIDYKYSILDILKTEDNS